MESTKVPIQKWFLAMFWITSSKKSISTLELMRKLNMTRYETTQNLAKKVRLLMRHYNDSLELGELNEADESFIVTAHSRKGSPKGRGTKQSLIHILATYEQKDTSGKHNGKALKNIKMELIEDASAGSIKTIWDSYLKKNSKVNTDGFRSYKKLQSDFPFINQQKSSGSDSVKHLPWVHTMASNFKKINLGVFHNTVFHHNVQNNLDEFCFKTNLRNNMKNWISILLTVGLGSLWNGWW